MTHERRLEARKLLQDEVDNFYSTELEIINIVELYEFVANKLELWPNEGESDWLYDMTYDLAVNYERERQLSAKS